MSAQGVLSVMDRLTKRYIANRGTPHQFISCVTPNVHGDDSALRKSETGADWLDLCEARATVAELIEACGTTVEYNRGVGFFVVKADGATPLSGKAHLFRDDAVQEREAAIDAALARCGAV